MTKTSNSKFLLKVLPRDVASFRVPLDAFGFVRLARTTPGPATTPQFHRPPTIEYQF
jgi:hypothetical protein